MNRKDVIDARNLARQFAKSCDDLLATKHKMWDGRSYNETDWADTWVIAGKKTGAHRRLSLDLTRALAHMRRRRP